MAVTRQSFARSVLSAINAPVTERNLKILIGWQDAEGGAGPQFGVAGNIANYNPLNTKQVEPGSTDSGGGIQSYKSWQQGLEATVATLNNGDYGSILRMLRTGDASAEVATSTIIASRWGTGANFVPSLITSAPYFTNDGGDPIQTVVGGGVFGMGGTGNSGNVSIDSLWTVGDSSNPDQDYWTTINQYCQDAQFYSFSDGETLFIADGIQIMGQQPQELIVLTDPRVVSANATYDNSGFEYTTTHLKKGNIIRRAALAKTQSPTEITITIICDVDRFRAGDTVYIKMFGPADGIWLISDSTRSVFSPVQQLTLSQGMAPVNALSGLAVGPAYESGKQASRPGSGTVITKMISEATTIANQKLPYEFGGGHAACGTPSPATQANSGNEGPPGTAGFDCSGAVCAVLAAGGLWKEGASVPGDADVISELRAKGLILPGAGSGRPECTLFDSPGVHIYMRLNGQYWGTWAGGSDAPGGGGWCGSGFPMPGFIPYHFPKSVLGQQPATGASQPAAAGTGSGGGQITMYDTTGTASDIPTSSPQAIAGYVDGNYQSYNTLAAAFPSAFALSICVEASGSADCLDIESGDASPSDAGTWAQRMISQGASRPCLYSDQNNMPAVKAALQAAGLSRSQYRLWVAAPSLGSAQVMAGYDATQWKFAGSYDQSLCLSNFFS